MYYAAFLNEEGKGLMVGKPFGQTFSFACGEGFSQNLKDEKEETKNRSTEIFADGKTENDLTEQGHLHFAKRKEFVYIFRLMDEQAADFEQEENLMASRWTGQQEN